jgi:hypothetical protein
VIGKPLPFKDHIFAGDAFETDEQLQAKVRSFEIKPFVYSAIAPGNFEPIPISAAEFAKAVECGWEDFSDPYAVRPPFQIMVVDRDMRRRPGTRSHVRGPHWIYLLKADLAPSKKSRAGRKAVYDWPEIRGFVFEQLTARGDFEEPDQIDGWKAAADLYRAIADKFGDHCPELSTLKERVPAFVDEWRAKVGN